MPDEMHEALKRQAQQAWQARRVDRTGWTDQQWCEDAERLMHDIDGAVTSLVNGHVNALLRERKRLLKALDESQLAYIEATNPGIDMEEVRRSRAYTSCPRRPGSWNGYCKLPAGHSEPCDWEFLEKS